MEAKAHNCLTRKEKKKLILAKHEADNTYPEIAGIVRRSKTVVYLVISRFKADKTLGPKTRTGRHPMITKHEDRMIVKMFLKDIFDKATFIYRAFCEKKVKPIPRKSVSRWLNKEEFVARIPCRKPLISKKNQMFVLTSPQSISCRQRNNGIWFTLMMNLNSTCLDLMVRGL